MAVYPLRGKHVVITGASDGIGRELALEAAKRGARVSLAARSENKLDAAVAEITAAGGSAVAVPTDVASETACRRLIERALAVHGDVDVLVCNAGLGSATQGDELIDVDVVRKLMDVNFFGAVYVTAAALPSILRRRGLVVAVSSIQGLLSLPKSSAYSASKHAMQGYFASLRVDLRGTGVDVTIVSPGAVATNIHRGQEVRYRGMTMEKVARRSMSARTCAKLICGAIEARRRDFVMTRGAGIAVKLQPFAPDFVDRFVAASVRRLYR